MGSVGCWGQHQGEVSWSGWCHGCECVQQKLEVSLSCCPLALRLLRFIPHQIVAWFCPLPSIRCLVSSYQLQPISSGGI